MAFGCVGRALRAIDHHGIAPERIDHAILAAINVTLCVISHGDARVANGFNDDIARNGRHFRPGFGARPVL